jgi:hypothetical protein
MNYRSQSLSVVLTTDNQAAWLERALASLHWTDEIIVVDAGSSDGTLEIARQHTEHVYYHPSRNPATRQAYGLSVANGTWVLLMEPYEWVEDMLRHEIDGLLLNPSLPVNGYQLPMRHHFQGKILRRGGDSTQRSLRLVRRALAELADDTPFAELWVPGHYGVLEHPLETEPYICMSDALMRANQRASWDALRQARLTSEQTSGPGLGEAIRLALTPVLTLLRHAFLKGEILDGVEGAGFATIRAVEAFLTEAKCVKMNEVARLQRGAAGHAFNG